MKKQNSIVSCIVLYFFICSYCVPSFAQEQNESTYINEAGQSVIPTPAPATNPQVNSDDLPIQNAIIEGVQISKEPGDNKDEHIVSGYFIFRDKPTSYFYEIKTKEKKLIFEFNDTKTGASPVPQVSEPPIKGFTIEERKINVNKDVVGLKPEWHDQIRIIFDLEAVPQIHVNDEYSIISFSYKWTTNPEKKAQYIAKDKSMLPVWLSISSLAGIGTGVLLYFLLHKKPSQEPEELDIGDLPARATK